jgi:REP element-mobilizing transposase RayT
MSKLRHIHLKEYPYVTTAVTLNREPIFADSEAANILLEAILFGKSQEWQKSGVAKVRSGKSQEWYYLLSFVIMPDHMHLIIIPKDKNISECMKSIKGYSARKVEPQRAKARGSSTCFEGETLRSTPHYAPQELRRVPSSHSSTV